MEAKSCKSANQSANKELQISSDCNLTDMAGNNVTERVLVTSEPNTTEDRESTKTILEDVCTDFESMDVINPKSNKIYVIKKQSDTSMTNSNTGKRNSKIDNVTDKAGSSGKKVGDGVAVPNSSPVAKGVLMNTLPTSEMNPQLDVASVSTEIESVQQSCISVLNAENPEILPSNTCQNPSNITVLPQTFAGEENIPLAQLADAEIVQSGDKVSIIVTNTRLIKVLTNANNSESSVQAVIDPSGMILETSGSTTEQIGILDHTVLTDSSFQSINILEDSSVVNEAVISDSENLLTSAEEIESDLTEDQLSALRKHSTPKGRPAKKAFRRSYTETGSSTKARRITAKMKAEWARQLEATGHLVCEMPGCSQIYVTVANFQTHYKYCTGKKSLQHCLYCDSLIFSSHKAVLHHMEVEHPDKLEEYKAQFPEETEEFEESVLPAHLIVAEDENVAMNVEEVTQQPSKNSRKRKLSSKENVASKKHCILKHKMQSIQNTVTENIKEFKKCVRFGDIVDKINSVDIAHSLELPVDSQSKGLKQKKERRRIILTESIVAEKKYFEDDDDVEPSKDSDENPEINPAKLNTKARMLLNMERYKRYKEYLKLTRDWSSERKTYSRSRTSDTSFDSSYLMALQNDYIQDTHQLNDTAESSSISLNTSETEITPNVTYLQAFEVLEASVPTQPDATVNEPPITTTNRTNENFSNELTPSEHHVNSHTYEPFLKREKTACYNRPSVSNAQIKIEALRPKPPKFEGIITYGMTVPGQVSKSQEPVVTFDSLISSIQQKQDRRLSSDKGTESCAEGENTPLKQEDGTKQSGDVIVNNSESPKKKRGRPPKPKPDLSLQQKPASDSKDIKKNNAKKFSTAMLKSIEKNVKKRHAKLFVMKKNSKFKQNLKKSGKNTRLHSRHSNLKSIHKRQYKRKLAMATNKNIQKKNLKHSLRAVNTIISKQEMHGKADSADESVIQCQENIDNHLLLGNESDTTHIQSLVTEHNYSHIINSVIEDHSIADANNVATEIEVVTSNVENATGAHEATQKVVNESTELAVEVKQKVVNESTEVAAEVNNVLTSHEVDHSKVSQLVENAIPENLINTENVPGSEKVHHSEASQKSENASPEVTSVVENKLNNSDANENVEIPTPEIKVKRGRGRPRKNQNKGSTPDVSSPLQNASNIVKVDKAEATNDGKGLQSEGETPTSVVDNNTPSTIRKSERVKRRKLVDDEIFETPKVEAKKKDEEAVLVIRTGRRGRPRKVHPKDSEASMSGNKVASPGEKCLETEHGSADENLRKYSRKGRPRKCVRYADLNSGVDSSESLDGLNSSVKDKTDRSKTLDSEHGEKENSQNNNSYEQDEAIVLPLKKRKQRQAKKDDSLLEDTGNDSTTKGTSNSGSMLDEEENIKNMELESEDDEEGGKKGTQSRRNSKNSKVSSRRKRIRHDSSDLESELSSYINNRNDESYTAPVTRQKSSNVDLLELDDETSDIEKNDADVNNRKDSPKRLNDSSLINRRVSPRSVARSKELKNAALKFSYQSAVNVLPDFKPQKCAWNLLSGKEFYDFSPPMKYSPYFKTEKTWTGSETNWTSLSVFDSAPIDRESCHGTFFTGGPVLCAAWCPTPTDVVQYVALAISCSLDQYHSYICTDPEKGLIQLWNLGLLHDKMLESKPVMKLTIAHSHGVITEMAWCPNGCWEDPSAECTGDTMPRLGMLAVACSDSNVRIYSIPHPTNESGLPIYESCPTIVLQPMYGEICCVTRKSMCISLSWQKYDNCEKVAAGYGNGMICVWRINTSATILISKENNQTKINPYLVFNAHGTPATGVCFAPLPGGRFLVSSSCDKTLKFWDLTDISLPFFTVKKGAARSAEWAHHYCGAFASLDHGMNCFKGSSFFKECGTESFPSRLLSNPSCFVMKSTMSEFLNAQAIADLSGCVSVSFTHSLLQEHVKSPQYFHRPAYLTETAVVEGIIEKIAFSSYPESINCISAIEEMKDIISVMNKMTEKDSGGKQMDVDSDKQLSVEDVTKTVLAESVSCLDTVLEVKEVVSVLMELLEKCENSVLQGEESSGETVTHESKENDLGNALNEKISEVADIVTVVSDLKDIASTVNELVGRSDDSKPVADVSFMEVDEEASCVEDQVPLVPDNELNSSVSAVENFCSESVACISAVVDIKDIVSMVDDITDKCDIVSLVDDITDKCDIVSLVDDITDKCDIVSLVDDITDKCDKFLKPDKLETLGDTETKYKCTSESDLALMANSKEISPCSIESVNSVIQGMKDVVCTLSGIVKDSSKELEEFEGKIEVTDCLIELLKEKKLPTSEERKEEKWIIQGTGLPFEFSEITDIVCAVMDLRDVTVTMEQLMKCFKGAYPVKSQLSSLTDLPSQSVRTSLEQSHSEPPICPEKTSIFNALSDVLETSAVVGDLVKSASQELDNELEIKSLLCKMIFDISKVDELKNCETQKPSTSSVSAESEGISTDCNKDVSNELITSTEKPSTEFSISSGVGIQCNNQQKQLHLLEEDEPMLSADGESSNSENEMDTDDELEVADSYVFDEKSGFSDDSYMSECSLDSNISMCSFSCESDMSENSLDSVPGDQEVLCSSIATKSPPSSELSQNLPSSEKDELESNVLDTEKAETTSLSAEEIVPSSNCHAVNLLSVSEDNLDISMRSETSETSVVTANDIPLDTEGLSSNVEKSCDIDTCSTEISENVVDISCTENIDENIADCVEKISQNDSNVLPKTVEKNIFDPEKVSETVVNSDHDEDNEENTNISINTTPVVDKKSFSPESSSSSENVISQYGLVFKDMNTAQFENIEDTSLEERDSLDQYHLASVKTIAWNPNYGSHFWLFSAGQSGIARISYISDINECKISKTRDGKDA